MSISLVVALPGTVAAAAGTLGLVARCARTPRADLIAWAIATAGFTVALVAQVLGYRRGFAPVTFRAVQIGTQLIAPLGLAWGIFEVAARSMPARFAARLLLSALAVIAGVILSIDTLGSQPFSHSWPAASVYYQVIPNALLKLIAAAAVLTALVGVIVAGVRGRNDRAWRAGFAAVGVAGVAILAAEGLAVRLPVNSGYPVLCVLAAGLAVLASVLAGRFQPAALRSAHGSGDDTGWDPAAGAGAMGSGQYGADDSLGLYRDSGRGGYPSSGGYGGTGGYPRYGEAGYGEPDASYDGPVTGAFEGPVTGAFEKPVTGAFGRPASGGFGGPDADGFDGPVTGAFDPLYQQNGLPGRSHNGDYERRGPGADPAAERGGPAALDSVAAGLAGVYDTERFYGQIAIYTLLEDGAAEFDRLAERVVEQVRAHEPDSLIYVVHGVPSAPLQRILYEVYRDRAAYDEHTTQSYIQEFEVGRRPLVLATNVIELGVRQAKASPIRPRPGGTPPLGQPPLGPGQSGPGQSGPGQSGPGQSGPPQSGPGQSGPPQSGPGPLGRPSAGTPPTGRPYGPAPGGRRGDRPPGGRAL